MNRIRVLVAKPGLDGHDRGAKVIARALRDAGMEGAHMAIVPRVLTLLRERGMPDVLVVVDGFIPEDDAKQLKLLGVAAVFQPGTSLESVVEFIRAAATIPA